MITTPTRTGIDSWNRSCGPRSYRQPMRGCTMLTVSPVIAVPIDGDGQ
jgi:hypothetical protein